MTDSNTSKLFIPYTSLIRRTYQKARRGIKKRTETKISRILQGLQDNIDVSVEDPLEDTQPAITLAENETMLNEFIDSDSETSDVGQYWKISNRKDSTYACIIKKNPFMVQFSQQNAFR